MKPEDRIICEGCPDEHDCCKACAQYWRDEAEDRLNELYEVNMYD